MSKEGVAILGIFVADLAFRAGRLPAIGETIAGSAFAFVPGGKGSNQAVAAARAGAGVTFITRIGNDTFGEIALKTWRADGIHPRVTQTATATGAAFIYVHETTGANAIIGKSKIRTPPERRANTQPDPLQKRPSIFR